MRLASRLGYFLRSLFQVHGIPQATTDQSLTGAMYVTLSMIAPVLTLVWHLPGNAYLFVPSLLI
jgi:hypothetical protein